MLQGGKKPDGKVSDIRCPMINHGGADALVRVKCIVEPELSNPPRGPTTPCIRFADLIHRFNHAKGTGDSPPVTLETEPRIGERDCDLIGHSYELPVVLAYLMAKQGRPKTRTIIATGRLVVKSGTVGIVGAFERKIDLLLEAAPHGSLFIYPRGNVAKENAAAHEKLERLKNERGVRCIPIEHVDDIKFLWNRRTAIFAIWPAAVVCVPLVVGVFLWLFTSQKLNSIPDPSDVSAVVVGKSINTASPDGAYHALLCKLLLIVLSNARSEGHKCTPSNGSPENIARGLDNPANFGYVQYDVWLRMAGDRAEVERKLFLIRDDIICEGLWMVTKKTSDLDSYGKILELSRDITFILPPKDSGPAWTFNYLRSKDPQLNRASRLQNEQNPAAVLDKVAKSGSTDKVVGFLVQYPTLDNAIIKRMMTEEYNVIPLGKEITDIRERGLIPYSWRTFMLPGACVKVGLITGRPEAFSSERDQEKQRELIAAVTKNVDKLGLGHTFSDYWEIFKQQFRATAG